jgi:signal transduction histidine kinase
VIRPLYTWVLFGLCLALATAAMGWVSWTALRLDAAEALAGRQAAHEENVRLALWRMDSTLAPLIAQESARPYFVYKAFYPAERAYTRMYAELRPNEILLPSPLLTLTSPEVVVHFEIGPDGGFSSPEAPQGAMLKLAERGYVSPERVRAAGEELVGLQKRLGRDALLASLPAPVAPVETPGVPMQQLARNDLRPGGGSNMTGQAYAPAPQEQSFDQQQEVVQQAGPQQPPPGGKMAAQRQAAKSYREFSKRSDFTQNAQQMAIANTNGSDVNRMPGLGPDVTTAVSEGILKPLWVGDQLVLARRVSVDHRDYVQGCLLNWEAIRRSLLADIADLLPRAQLEPVAGESGGAADRPTQMLASVPVRLVPGPVPEDPAPAVSPVRISLLIAWGCVLLAAAAIGVLLMEAVTLSERRGSFVSAVTHELRTPLTTLRMYTEMLAEGMVREEDKRRSYLQTMQVEADRLGHLVENVLAYSRIERGRARSHVVTLPVGELIARVRQRLSERAGQAGMRVVVEAGAGDGIPVRADPSAVEQILFNLVDNACKYAGSADEKSIHIEAGRQDSGAFIRVRDHGPGIGEADGRRLFRAFCKSAREAANSAPGVGLGLALSRRLAREMGGDLCLSRDGQPGACFVLSLPAGPAA